MKDARSFKRFPYEAEESGELFFAGIAEMVRSSRNVEERVDADIRDNRACF